MSSAVKQISRMIWAAAPVPAATTTVRAEPSHGWTLSPVHFQAEPVPLKPSQFAMIEDRVFKFLSDLGPTLPIFI